MIISGQDTKFFLKLSLLAILGLKKDKTPGRRGDLSKGIPLCCICQYRFYAVKGEALVLSLFCILGLGKQGIQVKIICHSRLFGFSAASSNQVACSIIDKTPYYCRISQNDGVKGGCLVYIAVTSGILSLPDLEAAVRIEGKHYLLPYLQGSAQLFLGSILYALAEENTPF